MSDERLRHWRSLDSAAGSAELLAFLDEFSGQPAVAASKRRSFDLLRIGVGDRVLDAGCGTGADVLALAPQVLPGGEAVGTDLSASAIELARSRAAGASGIRFEQGDITALPFPDGFFDAARADRTLLHVPDPERAVAELARVTRSAGAVVLTELTFVDSAGFQPVEHQPKLEGWQIMAFLPFLLNQAGVEHVTVDHTEVEVELSERLRAVLAARTSTIQLKMVHAAGTVAAT